MRDQTLAQTAVETGSYLFAPVPPIPPLQMHPAAIPTNPENSDNQEIANIVDEHYQELKNYEDSEFFFAGSCLSCIGATAGAVLVDALAYKKKRKYEDLLKQSGIEVEETTMG